MKKAWLLGVLSLGVTLGVGGQSYLIETVAGGYTIADGGPATNAFLHFPTDVVVDKNGNIFLADTGNQRIRKIAPNGVITTVAGTGTMGFSGDGGRAIDAQLNLPNGVAVDDS
ncbi:MAG: hypothetical protein HY238_13085, partial [Acidobacteria bacterium]|nr:hypothetical protein [Acidobacteriota bacterium]